MPFDELLPRANLRYTGSRWSFWFLAVVTFVSTARSLVHMLAPDGGASSIAHIALNVAGGPNIVAVFSQWGASQLVLACVQWVVVLRYRFLVPAMLALLALEQVLRFLAGHLKPLQVESAPPGAYATFVIFVLSLVFVVLSLRQERR
jgi:hypothetical protein